MPVDADSMNGLAKRVFDKSLVKTIPQFAKLTDLVKFSSQAKTGEEFEILVQLTRSQGFTYQGTNRRKIYDLEDARSMTTAPARIKSCEIVGLEQFAYGELAAAEKAGEQAYAAALGEGLLSIYESARFRQEADFLYGGTITATGAQPGFGTIETETDGTTTSVFKISASSWSPGIWSQLENAAVDVYSSDLGTKRNTDADIIVGAVDHDLRLVNVTGDETDLNGIQVGDIILPAGAKGEQITGLDGQACNTASFLGIDPSLHQVWRANKIDGAGKPVSVLALHKLATRPMGRGLMGNVKAYVSTYALADMIDDTTGLRRINESSPNKVEQGTKSLVFYGAQGGSIEIEAHPMLKAGDVFIFDPADLIRGGDSDLVDRIPGTPGEPGKIFFHLQGKTGCETHVFQSQFILHKKPSRLIKGYGFAPRSAP